MTEDRRLTRLQGRPVRGESEVGRDKLVEATLKLLRTNPNADISRKDIASFAGVTPALVSYYFGHRVALVEAATCPVVRKLIVQVHSIVRSGRSYQETLSELIVLFLETYADEPYLRVFVSGARQREINTAVIDALKSELTEFFSEVVKQRGLPPDSSHTLQSSFLALCMYFSMPHSEAPGESSTDGDRAYRLRWQAHLIFDVLSAAMPGEVLAKNNHRSKEIGPWSGPAKGILKRGVRPALDQPLARPQQNVVTRWT